LVRDGLVPTGYLFIIATGVTHAFYFVFLSRAYTYGNISVVYPIARGCGVVGTAVIAILLLRESVSARGITGILCTSLGILFIGSGRGKNADYRKGLAYALLVGITMMFYSIIDKTAMASVHPVVYITGLFLLSVFILTPYVLVAKGSELGHALATHKKDSLLIGIGSAAGYLMILFVLQTARVSYVIAAREVSVAIGAVLGMIFLGEAALKNKIAGIILIVLGLILIKIS
jgi:drug/metabolite transporter (DMT)-like permease